MNYFCGVLKKKNEMLFCSSSAGDGRYSDFIGKIYEYTRFEKMVHSKYNIFKVTIIHFLCTVRLNLCIFKIRVSRNRFLTKTKISFQSQIVLN